MQVTNLRMNKEYSHVLGSLYLATVVRLAHSALDDGQTFRRKPGHEGLLEDQRCFPLQQFGQCEIMLRVGFKVYAGTSEHIHQ